MLFLPKLGPVKAGPFFSPRDLLSEGSILGVHLCALGDLVDNLFVSPESNSNRVGFGGVMLSKYGSVGIIMPGAEHFLDLGNRIDTLVVCTVADIGQYVRRASQYDYRLHLSLIHI